ncbi:alpha-tocopherol transfer protein-related [Holotrichia oblita]|uniref:Alpha-tocopherol transfer protein-related n=1 Tax=Holotrichia oblita TaxID=644536 RepID=A0ACB9TGP8_HOLOL|nr:alpha-tocopherol transfer protein-related [Holotrichia oblita]
MFAGETDLKCPYYSDTWLVRFLRPCKFYPENAHQLVKRYYAFKLKHNTFYENLIPANEKNIFEHDILTVLPTRDQHKRRILVIELGKKWKHTKCSLDEVFKGCVLYLEAALLENLTQVGGVVVIFDMDGLSMQQTWQFTPPFAKRIVDWLQDSIPCRVKNIHIINQPYIFNIVFALFKPFLREKLKKRIIFHGTDRKSLHSYLTPGCLPKCYGGTMEIPRITGSQWLELLNMCDEEYKGKHFGRSIYHD